MHSGDEGFIQNFVWKRPLKRPRHGSEDNIKMHVRETGREGVDWICLTQDRNQWWAVVNTVMNLHIP